MKIYTSCSNGAVTGERLSEPVSGKCIFLLIFLPDAKIFNTRLAK
jgi:hypothetical protein